MATYDITILGSGLEYDTTSSLYNVVYKWTDTRVIVVWQRSTSFALMQAFDVNTGTGAFTALGSVQTIDGTDDGRYFNVLPVDSTHFIVVWRNDTAGGVRARAWSIDSGGTIASAGSNFSVTDITAFPSAIMIDATHFIIMGQGAGSDGFAKIHEVNTGTWAITASGSAYEFDNSNFTDPEFGGLQLALIDSTHVQYVWVGGGGNEGNTGAFIINNSTWAITTGSQITVQNPGNMISVTPLDNVNHFLAMFRDSSSDGIAQVVEVNLSTFASTEVGTPTTYRSGTLQNTGKGAIQISDEAVATVVGDGGNGELKVVSTDGSWVLTSHTGTQLNVGAAGFGYPSLTWLSATNILIVAYQGTSGDDGYLQAYTIEMPATTAIKTWDGLANASIKTVEGLTRANVKTINGLA